MDYFKKLLHIFQGLLYELQDTRKKDETEPSAIGHTIFKTYKLTFPMTPKLEMPFSLAFYLKVKVGHSSFPNELIKITKANFKGKVAIRYLSKEIQ